MGFYKLPDRMIFLFLIAFAVIGCHQGVRPVEELKDIPRMTNEELKAKLGDPMIAIIDVRYTPNWKKSDRKISGAVREDPVELSSWIDRYPRDLMLVLYCD
jgi:hypothetical protein